MTVPPCGPVPARIMLVGEAPGEQEVLRREPFVGTSGQELNRMLHEAGIMRSECFITNVARERPPENDISKWIAQSKKEITPDMLQWRSRWIKPQIASGIDLLRTELDRVQPHVIVAFGNVSMWALTGKWGIKSWRGSLLQTDTLSSSNPVKVIPVYHPAYILRDWSARHISVQDLRRVKKAAEKREVDNPQYSFIIRPSFETVFSIFSELEIALNRGPTVLSVDIETRGGHTACVGIAWSKHHAICIPFMCTERQEGYWSAEEELAITLELKRLLTHPHARVIGQNFAYDAQYFLRHWGYVPRFERDTMLGHHSCFSGLPKGLDYLSSLYCEHHVYWKDESKDWDPKLGEDQLWAYNCKDAVITYECDEEIQATVDKLGLREQHDFQQQMFWRVLRAMSRGIRVDKKRRSTFALELSEEISKREQWFIDILGHPLNPKSPKQMQQLFYEDLRQKPQFNRKTKQVTLNDEALKKIGAREPLLRPLVTKISEFRSLGVFLSTFVGASLDKDERIRCSFNVAGTETYRLSSSENAFGSGLNLQNIPKGGEEEALTLPNVRELFIPDPGYTFFDGDLDRADLQVVVWEADDAEFKEMLRAGVDIHIENAKTLGIGRELAKRWVHGTNYGGGPRTMAIGCGITVHQAERMQARWFAAHPGIKRWHDRVEAQLHARRYVENAFGYRRYYFDRVEGLLPEALAWGPQSTVAIVINRIWTAIDLELPDVQVLLQVHDSLAGQIPTVTAAPLIRRISELANSVVVPYDDPLVIPFKIKTSTESWGDCK